MKPTGYPRLTAGLFPRPFAGLGQRVHHGVRPGFALVGVKLSASALTHYCPLISRRAWDAITVEKER